MNIKDIIFIIRIRPPTLVKCPQGLVIHMWTPRLSYTNMYTVHTRQIFNIPLAVFLYVETGVLHRGAVSTIFKVFCMTRPQVD